MKVDYSTLNKQEVKDEIEEKEKQQKLLQLKEEMDEQEYLVLDTKVVCECHKKFMEFEQSRYEKIIEKLDSIMKFDDEKQE